MQYLTVDGMMSGTGVRDSIVGGYLDAKDLGISSALQERVAKWLGEYSEEHYNQYQDYAKVQMLDEEGLKISTLLQRELSEAKVEYFSCAKMEKVSVPNL